MRIVRPAVFLSVLTLLVALTGLSVVPAPAPMFTARLSGDEETPAISTTATGRFNARIIGSTIEYELTYEGLTADATAAHIHLGQRGVAGGVSAFLCGGGGKPACPPGTTAPASVTGTIVASDVIGPAGQGIAAGEIDELIRAILKGLTYANVHNVIFPNGEIRGQVRRRDNDD